MTPQERQLIDDLFDRLAKLEGSPRDRDAEAAIMEGLRRAPNAAYARNDSSPNGCRGSSGGYPVITLTPSATNLARAGAISNPYRDRQISSWCHRCRTADCGK